MRTMEPEGGIARVPPGLFPPAYNVLRLRGRRRRRPQRPRQSLEKADPQRLRVRTLRLAEANTGERS